MVLNIDDTHLVAYSLKKLVAARLIVVKRQGRESHYEPRRVCRRLQLLSKVEHHEQDNEQVFSGSA